MLSCRWEGASLTKDPKTAATIFWQHWPQTATPWVIPADETRELETQEVYLPLKDAAQRPLGLRDTIPDALYVESAADQSREVTSPQLRFADIEDLTLQPLTVPCSYTAVTRKEPEPTRGEG